MFLQFFQMKIHNIFSNLAEIIDRMEVTNENKYSMNVFNNKWALYQW